MPSPDPAKAIKDALAGEWATAHPTWAATLMVDDDFKPAAGAPLVLIAEDGGPHIIPGPWLLRQVPRRTTLRFTGFAVGRTEARTAVDTAVNYVITHKPGIARVEDLSAPLITRDRATGAILASITMPVVVKYQ